MEDPKIIAERIIGNVEKVIIGKEREVRLALVALLCQGHVLIEDVPGVGKTILARSLAVSAGCNFRRIQFTPDLLPSDVTGVSIYNQKTGDFEFRPGPIVAQVVLADEINRATPKTQSSLLEAMEERQVTVDGVTHKMPAPFIVLATQNPIEYEGTFPLPRGAARPLPAAHPPGLPVDDRRGADHGGTAAPASHRHARSGHGARRDPQHAARRQGHLRRPADQAVHRQHRRRDPKAWGRCTSARRRAARSRSTAPARRALLDGRDFVLPDDVKELAYATLGHRIIIAPAARVKNATAKEVVEQSIERIPVPGARARQGAPAGDAGRPASR